LGRVLSFDLLQGNYNISIKGDSSLFYPAGEKSSTEKHFTLSKIGGDNGSAAIGILMTLHKQREIATTAGSLPRRELPTGLRDGDGI
jgi:hypothetical protein